MTESFIPDPNAPSESQPVQYIPIPDGFVENPSGPVESRVVVENNAAEVFPMSPEEVDAVFRQFRTLAIKAMDNPIPIKTIDANDLSSDPMPPDPIASWDKDNHGAPTPAEINQLQVALKSTMQRLITVNERLKNFPSPTEDELDAVPPTPYQRTGLANLVPEPRITELSNLLTVMEKVAHVARVVPGIQTEFSAVPTEQDVRILEQRYDIIRRRLANYEDAERAQQDAKKVETDNTINYPLEPLRELLAKLDIPPNKYSDKDYLRVLLKEMIDAMGLNNKKIEPTFQNEPPDRIYRTEPWQSYERHHKPNEILPIDLFEENIRPQPFWDGPFQGLIDLAQEREEQNPLLAEIVNRLLRVPKLPTKADLENNSIASPPTSDVQGEQRIHSEQDEV